MNQPFHNHEFIEYSPPCLGEEEIAEVVDTLRSQWLTMGPKVQRFEREFSDLLGAPSAVAVNSCTAALQLALEALEIGPGDEVITTTLTFASTVNVIEHRGARPVLVDVDPDTLNIDPGQVANAITPRTKVIVPVHFAGHPAEMRPLISLAEKHGIAVVEDAAHALPARYDGSLIGGGERPTAFSFYVTKNYTTGEGGMLTGPPKLLERARLMRLHGMNRNAWSRYSKQGSWYYEVVAPGFKCNMTDVQAAIGLHQIRKMERYQQRRRQIWDRYTDAFQQTGALETPTIRAGVGHARHLYVLRLLAGRTAIGRDELILALKQRGIGTSVHFIPVHLHPYYQEKYGFRPDDFPVALSNFKRMLSLPMHAHLRDEDVERVIHAVTALTSPRIGKAA